MIKFNNQPLIVKKLLFLSRYANTVTVTKNSLTTKNMQVIFPEDYNILLDDSIDKEFSIKISDILYLFSKTDECLINKKYFIIKYQMHDINIEKKFKRYDEIFVLPCSEPNLSIKIGNFVVLSEDDVNIVCNNQGLFEMSSALIIETRLTLKNCTVISSKIENVSIKLKSKDIRILENFQNDKIFCFFDNYVLVYILENKITNVVLLQILQK